MGGQHHYHTHAEGHHCHARPGDNRAFAVGLALNAGFVALEVVFGVMADSLALLADAGHNAVDVLGLALAWGAGALSSRPPGERYTYGLQSASILAALINGALLVLVAFEIGREAFLLFWNPCPPAAGMVMAVAACGVVINGVTAWLFMRGGKDDVNMRGVFLHMAGDALVSLGVVVSGALALWTAYAWIDPVAGLLIAVVILAGSRGLMRDALRLILHAVPSHIELKDVRALLESFPFVTRVHDLHVWAMSANENALSAHMVVSGGYPGGEWFREMERQLELRFRIGHTTVQVELSEPQAFPSEAN